MNKHFLIKSSFYLIFLTITSIVLIGLFDACSSKKSNYKFKNISASHSGLTFSNTINETEDFNILNFHYIYNGGGVGVGDFDKNGYADLVFTGNQVDSKIYLNKGNLEFEDITQASNMLSEGWVTGVSIVDINSDGWQDIYLSVGGANCKNDCHNQLFINQGLNKKGVPQFIESAQKYGLDDGLYTQQAAFFDYDLDGDLDVYLLHNVIDIRDKNAPSAQHFINKDSKDQLLRNDGFQNGKEGLVYTDISEEAGIVQPGYGLGININDFNKDGFPDIYVANDFLSNDLFFLNKGKKQNHHLGFDEISQRVLKHSSYNSMGVDVADVNNDGLAEIIVLDMMPEYQERQKNMVGFMNYDKFLLSLKQGYSPQFVRNTLQVHNGLLNDSLLAFTEVGYYAGIYNTDWSWAPLLADYDNDGDRDLFVTNGYGKNITDLDFINFSNLAFGFGSKEGRNRVLFEKLQEMESVLIPNYIFENEGELKFTNRSKDWMEEIATISNGAVFVDLDNDGDLDLTVNNIDAPVLLLENTKDISNNWIKVDLKGNGENTNAIGAEITIWMNEKSQTQYHAPYRGYLSSVDQIEHFGIGTNEIVDSIIVSWPGGRVSKKSEVSINQKLIIKESESYVKDEKIKIAAALLFSEDNRFPNVEHKENIYFDFDAQPLLMKQLSKQGPCVAIGDVNKEPGDEIFIGGAKGIKGAIYKMGANGSFDIQFLSDSLSEDVAAAFLDIDLDGDLDLYVVSGGTEFLPTDVNLEDRIYLNDGFGEFIKLETKLPTNSGACVVSNDFDHDGDIDLFIGGRIVPGKYPDRPESYLLKNNNGHFEIDTTYSFQQTEMVTDAIWSDYDQDGWADLIVVGEWMPVLIYNNKEGELSKSATIIENSAGLWNCIKAADFDKDGDEDYILGNIGLNSRFKASKEEPLTLYTADFDNNNSNDPIIGQYYLNKKGERALYPINSRDDVMKQVSKLKNKFLKYSDFGSATFFELLDLKPDDQDLLMVTRLASSYLENKGTGKFEMKSLPAACQMGPIQDILIYDFNEDDLLDVLLVGNDFTSEKNGGWLDGLNGVYLQGKKEGAFQAIQSNKSGFYVAGDARTVSLFKLNNEQEVVLVGQNTGFFKFFH